MGFLVSHWRQLISAYSLLPQPRQDGWRGVFQLDGLSIPKGGDARNDWELCYSVKAAGHYFTAEFEGGHVARVCVDG